MATLESLTKRLDDLDKDRGYFTIEEIVFALEREKQGDSMFDILHREHPGKTLHPDLVGFLLKQSQESRSE